MLSFLTSPAIARLAVGAIFATTTTACVASSGGTGSTGTGAADTAVQAATDTGLAAETATADAGATADTAATADSATTADTAATPDAAADTAAAAPCLKEKVSTQGMYKVCLDGPDTLKAGVISSYIATITPADPANAQLPPSVKFIHIQMGHGGFKVPAIAQDGPADHYKITNIAPSMAGTWRLTLTFTKGDDASWDIAVK